MARAPFNLTVLDTAGNVKAGASVTIRRRSDSAISTVYAAETGTGTVANPVSTDVNGRATGWLDRGAYRLDVTGSGITAYSVNFDASPAADGAVDTAWLASAALPLGSLMPYAGAADPVGGFWLLADGRAVSRATYAGLFNIIGTTFGAGDGSTTFNLPDTRGRVPLGAGTGPGAGTTGVGKPAGANLTARALAAYGGDEAVTLSAAQSGLQDHTHGISLSADSAIDGRRPQVAGRRGPVDWGQVVGSPTDPTNISTSGAANASASHPNMPPFLALNYVIRAL